MVQKNTSETQTSSKAQGPKTRCFVVQEDLASRYGSFFQGKSNARRSHEPDRFFNDFSMGGLAALLGGAGDKHCLGDGGGEADAKVFGERGDAAAGFVWFGAFGFGDVAQASAL